MAPILLLTPFLSFISTIITRRELDRENDDMMDEAGNRTSIHVKFPILVDLSICHTVFVLFHCG